MIKDIIYSIVFNISVLIAFGYALSKLNIIKNAVLNNSFKSHTIVFLSLAFGSISIFMTINGVETYHAIANARTIPIVASGIIFGPIVGIASAVMASIHRYFFVGSDFTSLACSISILVGGIIGGYFSTLKFNKHSSKQIFFVVIIIETIQMILILLIAKPYEDAVALVKIIGVPMVLLNSLGTVLFVKIFYSIYFDIEKYSALKVDLVLNITNKCLPYLKKGISDKSSLDKASSIIAQESNASLVLIASKDNEVLSLVNKLKFEEELLDTFIQGSLTTKNKVYLYKVKSYIIIGCKLHSNNDVSGCLIMAMQDIYMQVDSKINYVYGLANILSTQLELALIDQKNNEIKKAEFNALQAQISPHFLCNVLNTIIYVSRQDEDKARELLVDLSTYFRNITRSDQEIVTILDELDYLDSYVKLERERFIDKIDISISSDVSDNIKVPRFIIQPLVENSLKHAFRLSDSGYIKVKVQQTKRNCLINVIDNGCGFENKDYDFLLNEVSNDKIGLNNVNQRIVNYYGKGYGLKIIEKQKETIVQIRVPLSEVSV